MRVLWLQPRLGGSRGRGGIRSYQEPLGICYCASALACEGHKSLVLHQIDESDERIVQEVRTFAPDVVGISSMTHNWPLACEFARSVKMMRRSIPVVAGGDHPSADYAGALQEQAIDVVVIGEGEVTVVDLLRAFQDGRGLSSVPGIAFRTHGGIARTLDRPLIGDLDSLPLPSREGLPMDRYRYSFIGAPPVAQQRGVSILTSRGCRFNCSFCSTPVVWRRSWRSRSAENVLMEVAKLVRAYGANFVWLRDEDAFGNAPERMHAIAKGMIHRGLRVKWRSFLSPRDIVDHADTLALMRESGYVATIVGIESFNDSTLKSLGKPWNAATVSKAIEILDRLDIASLGTVMIGYPDESESELLHTLHTLLDLPLDDVYLPYLTPFPGTQLARELGSKGTAYSLSLEDLDCTHRTIECPIPTSRLAQLRDEFLMEFYTRKAYQARVQQKIQARPELGPSYADVFEALGLPEMKRALEAPY